MSEQDPRSDEELLSAYAQHNDTRAFAALVRRHNVVLRAVAYRVLWSREDAEQAVQEAWLQVVRTACRSDWAFQGRAALSTWLATVARNTAISHLRRRTARPTVAWPEGHDWVSPRDPAAEVEARILVADLLGVLPEHMREVIELVWLRGLSVGEAAQTLGIAEGTVKSRTNRARQLMADRLTRDQQ